MNTLLQTTLIGSVMIIAVTLLRILALNKLPKRLFVILWGLCCLRLLLPYTLPSSFSAYNMLPQQGNTATSGSSLPIAEILEGGYIQSNYSAPHNSAIASINWPILVWFTGALLCALVFIIGYSRHLLCFREASTINNSWVANWLQENALRRRIQVRISSRIKAPLTYGILRPVILLPASVNVTDTKLLDVMLTHERQHIRSWDMVKKLALAASLCIHWFNPFVWGMFLLANRDIELSCDMAVVKRLGSRRSYAGALLQLEEQKAPSLYPAFSRFAIKERIGAIMNYKKTGLLAGAVSVAVLGAIALVLGTGALPSETSPVVSSELDIQRTGESFIGMYGSKPFSANESNDFSYSTVQQDEAIARQEWAAFGLTAKDDYSGYYFNGEPVKAFIDDRRHLNSVDSFYGTFSVFGEGTLYLKTERAEDGTLLAIVPMAEEEIKEIDALYQQSWENFMDEFAEFDKRFERFDGNMNPLDLALHTIPDMFDGLFGNN